MLRILKWMLYAVGMALAAIILLQQVAPPPRPSPAPSGAAQLDPVQAAAATSPAAQTAPAAVAPPPAPAPAVAATPAPPPEDLPRPPAKLWAALPKSERDVIDIMRHYCPLARAAPKEQQSALGEQVQAKLAAAVPGGAVSTWAGRVSSRDIDDTSAGLEVTTAPWLAIKTAWSSWTDYDRTLIKARTRIYEMVSHVEEGDVVAFSAMLLSPVATESDCIIRARFTAVLRLN